MNTLADFLTELKDRIKEAGSTHKLAREMNMSQATIANIAAGKQPPGEKFLSYFGWEIVRTVEYRKCPAPTHTAE